ncbi:MAG: L,D-transpeptidase [Lachnospiraceae bacterium]
MKHTAPSWGTLVAETRAAERTNQILLLLDHTLTLWEKGADWTCVYCSYAGYGRNGLSENRHEGDGTTPVGDFALPLAFGIRKNPGTALPYQPVGENSYWAEEGNRYTESPVPVPGEHLASYDPQYRYAVFIAYNADPCIPGRGSAIFLHVRSEKTWKTAGCVSVTEENMIRLLHMLRPGARMLIAPSPEKLITL